MPERIGVYFGVLMFFFILQGFNQELFAGFSQWWFTSAKNRKSDVNGRSAKVRNFMCYLSLVGNLRRTLHDSQLSSSYHNASCPVLYHLYPKGVLSLTMASDMPFLYIALYSYIQCSTQYTSIMHT